MNEYDGIRRAADWIADADGIVIAAGAGMSVDSGLPDFRGTGGLWTSLL
ncbi:TPA: RNA polymerase subunit sigma, partial [Burkholderia vietnamiensis]|nr:RNA polymerase subunit sigma [Burkholderia vietnamiensis]